MTPATGHVIRAARSECAACAVAPGFDFADFEIARRADLLAAFPQHDAIITAMTRPVDSGH